MRIAPHEFFQILRARSRDIVISAAVAGLVLWHLPDGRQDRNGGSFFFSKIGPIVLEVLIWFDRGAT